MAKKKAVTETLRLSAKRQTKASWKKAVAVTKVKVKKTVKK